MAQPRTAARGTATRPGTSGRQLDMMSVWALVLSFLGITSPIGLYLGYRSRDQLQRTRDYGEPFARAAIIVGWAYIVLLIVAILAYLIIFVF